MAKENNSIVSKQFIDTDNKLNKSKTSQKIQDVVFKDNANESFDVFAVTSQGKDLIGRILPNGHWIGSPDLITTPDGKWVRLFKFISSNESIDEAKKNFVVSWKGRSLFVHPTFPSDPNEGDIYFIGGDSILLKAWINQSKVYMKIAIEQSNRDGLYLNTAYILAGYAIELLFKALAWISNIKVIPTHEISYFYKQLDDEKQKKIDSISKCNGWESANAFVEYVDNYLAPASRRYLGISTKGQFRELNINSNHKLSPLNKVHQNICQLLDQHLS